MKEAYSGQVVHTNVLLSPSSIIWYLARAFMLTRQLCGCHA